MRTHTVISSFLSATLLFGSCKEKYVPQLKELSTDYLVVDGFINSGQGATKIELSRTTKVSAVPKPLRETKAAVRVEGMKNTTGFVLMETSPGVYTHPQLTLDPTDRYRVNIRTQSGKTYVSDYSSVRQTPDIDSISWRMEDDGVQIYADTHDDKTDVGYYLFRFDETYIIHARYQQFLKLIPNRGATYIDPFTRKFNDTIWTCWKYDTTYTINIYSTENLTANRVSLFPLKFFERNSEALSDRYSIHVHMFAMSRACYRFWDQLKKNTQQIGSMFDAQPSENNGNMQCLSNPGERVIGFVEVAEEKSKRIFIDNAQLPGVWHYYMPGCSLTPVLNSWMDLQWLRPSIEQLTDFHAGATSEVDVAPIICVDCTLRGTNKKPVFW